MPSRTIVLADDHELVREGLKSMIALRSDLGVVGETGDGLELMELLREGPVPDVVLLDLTMPNLSGMEALQEIAKIDPHVAVIVFTMHKDQDLLCNSLVAGADGYVLKDDTAELFAAIDAVLGGKTYVSATMRIGLTETWLSAFVAIKGSHPCGPLSSREVELLKGIVKAGSERTTGSPK